MPIAPRPCDVTGRFLADGAPPTPPPIKSPDDWAPYRNRVEFETAEFLYTRNQMSAGDINILLDLWAATLLKYNDKPPLRTTVICIKLLTLRQWVMSNGNPSRSSTLGEARNQCTTLMDQSHDVWYRDPHEVIQNMLGNSGLRYRDGLSALPKTISEDPDTLGSTFVPSSVATGANDYYPLYVSIGNVRNNVRRAHRDASSSYRGARKRLKISEFRRQLFHSSVAKILENLRPGMTTPEVVRFGDGHYRRVIYGLGPILADYEEQVLLACIVRNCVRGMCMSHPDSLDTKSLCRRRDHTEALVEEATYGALWMEYGIVGDLVGTFKDHLVKWVGQYLQHVHGTKEAERIQADIDRRIAAVASFAGLRRFPEGRGFKQWTGDDSKALMKVYLPAIEGHVPTDVVRTFRAFLEFCYLVRRNIITESTLGQIQEALDRFHHYREIFESTGVVFTFSLPRQHSCSHYVLLIQLFGAPNGLCSSITETKHIKAVKEPWRRSSRYKALGQMLVTNQRLDKLAAAHIDFKNRGIQPNENSATVPVLFNADVTIQGDNEEGEIDNGPTLVQAHVQLAKTPQRKRAHTIPELSTELSIPNLYNVLRRFLFEQVYPDDQHPPSEIPLSRCPRFDGNIQVFNSASSTFYAPSDRSGIGGMRREHIHACPIWRNEAPRYDCVFVNTDASVEGMVGMDIARVMCFFSFTFNAVSYPCAVVRWFDKASDGPDQDTGMWIVTPSFDTDHSFSVGIIHIDSIYCAAHLIPVYGAQIISHDIKHHDSYDAFRAFYLNKFADHHAFEVAS
ncbi:uncharacterized protein EDB93DRAFT_1243604 [Suillus bovinus]|uniref:uncharacterized protein n=1 Tax=Suillus bovinus TaxID=48563 RepID=UPI001B85BEE0|nr:uncharacterized protein EDB93DRAFT_1243604 [Suillus bovinus]KAG2128044.1 hypothetical protein EDB93DRAFT_1243604 [Suillus bovinus]